ncbi:hypothetical protein G6L37_06675 [Agrobacterium rubi]|nr:hypothetical protein [Agrobacterium rubi]NTF25048.1 hypothetical protein [Agrobacterium rubi]
MTDNTVLSAPRWGHGLCLVTEVDWQTRRSDVEAILVALESSTTPEWSTGLSSAIRRTTTMLGRVAHQVARDWFVTSGLLSHPCPLLLRRLSSGLHRLHEELDRDDIPGINAALDNLEAAFAIKVFSGYLDATRPTNPITRAEPSGWVYLLTSASDPTMLLAGYTDGKLTDVVDETSRANSAMSAFGIATAWRVTDPELAHRMVVREIGHRHVANGYHAFGDLSEFREARREIDEALTNRKIVVGNPFWEPVTECSILSVDPYSADIRNRKFKVDIGGVFDAFRR